MPELIPIIMLPADATNDQRHDAALYLAERYSDQIDELCLMLEMLGLAERDENEVLRPTGTDEYEISWFTKRHPGGDRCAMNRSPAGAAVSPPRGWNAGATKFGPNWRNS